MTTGPGDEVYWAIYFRMGPPEMYMAPIYCTPSETMGIKAKTGDEARRKFIAGLPENYWYEIQSIELMYPAPAHLNRRRKHVNPR